MFPADNAKPAPNLSPDDDLARPVFRQAPDADAVDDSCFRDLQ
jgi:hypothetical protein